MSLYPAEVKSENSKILTAGEIGGGDGGNDGALLKQEGLNQGSQNAVGMGAGLGAIMGEMGDAYKMST
ncbi:MAG: hypothetical protein IPN90_02520 [Elusimicrobia bacterium]|nr:hypothetical protein [Elusimicrobiota bacterium]